MHEKVLRMLGEKIRQRDYVVTTHADEEMYEDGLSIWDVEEAILTGTVAERQRDRWMGEWKYVIRGKSKSQADMAAIAKIGYNRRVAIITVYLLDT